MGTLKTTKSMKVLVLGYTVALVYWIFYDREEELARKSGGVYESQDTA